MPYTKHLPKILTEYDLNLISDKIFSSPFYSNNHCGTFLRWRDWACFHLMFYTGLRPIECLELKWTDIDFDTRLIQVRPYLNHHRKNDLPAILTKPAIKILHKYQEKLKEFDIHCEWLFPSFWVWKPITTSAMNKRFLELCKEAGIASISYYRPTGQPKWSLSLYSLRHSFLTKVWKAKHSDIVVSRLARHTRIESASTYVHLDYEDKIELADDVWS